MGNREGYAWLWVEENSDQVAKLFYLMDETEAHELLTKLREAYQRSDLYVS